MYLYEQSNVLHFKFFLVSTLSHQNIKDTYKRLAFSKLPFFLTYSIIYIYESCYLGWSFGSSHVTNKNVFKLSSTCLTYFTSLTCLLIP